MSRQIVEWLAELWSRSQSADFADYLYETFGRRPHTLPEFECIYVTEAEAGDFATGSFCNSFVKQWWKVDSRGVTDIHGPHYSCLVESEELSRWPVVKFFTDGKRILIGERLGPDFVCRKVGNLIVDGASLRIADIRIVWNSQSILT